MDAFHSALWAQTLEAKNNSNNNENELKRVKDRNPSLKITVQG